MSQLSICNVIYNNDMWINESKLTSLNVDKPDFACLFKTITKARCSIFHDQLVFTCLNINYENVNSKL